MNRSRQWATPLILAVATLASAESIASQQSGNVRTAAISGVVVDGSSGRAVKDVLVGLRAPDVKVALGTLTDSKGRFVFTELPASDRYTLFATKSGYVAGRLALRTLDEIGPTFSLSGGQWRSDVVLDIWPLGSISGNVIDERGEPAVDLLVRVLSRVWLGGRASWISGPVVRTDDRGFYRIAALPRGSYVVTVPSIQSTVPAAVPLGNLSGLSNDDLKSRRQEAPRITSLDLPTVGFRLLTGQFAVPPAGMQSYPQLFNPGVRSLSDATVIDLNDGESRHGVSVALSLVTTASVSGRVVGPREVIAGLSLRLVPSGLEFLGSGGIEQATTISDGDGAFLFAAVPSGTYTLQAATWNTRLSLSQRGTSALPQSPGRTFGSLRLNTAEGLSIVTREESGDRYFAQASVVVESQDVRDVLVVLERGGTISGQVVREDGAALPSLVRVWFEAASGDPSFGRFETSVQPVQPATGSFSIQGLRQGAYVLRVLAGNLVVKSVTLPEAGAGQVFQMERGSTVTGVVVTVTDRSATLSGSIHRPDGSVPEDSAVVVFPVERSQWKDYGMQPPHIRSLVFFGRDGFRFTGLAAGQYHIVAIDKRMLDAWRDPGFLERASLVADRLSLDWGTTTVRNLTVKQVSAK